MANYYNKTPRVSVVYDFKKKASETKKGDVYVRVYHNHNKRVYISTGVQVYPSEWSDEFHVYNREDAVQLNRVIDEQYKKACDMVREAVQANNDLPERDVMKIDRSDASFLDFMINEIENSDLAKGTLKHHRTVYSSLCEFGKIRRYEHVTPSNVNQYIQWIKKRTIGKLVDGEVEQVPISQVAVYDYFKVLRKYVRVAQERGYLPLNALLGVHVSRGQSGEREHLSDEEIKRWINTPMPNVHLRNARDRFIVQMGTGLSYADMLITDFTKRQVLDGMTTLSGRRVKTNKNFFLVILPMAVDVLSRWEWKVPKISNQDYNRYLTEVASICQIEKHITSHIGRHTYACQCLANGVRLEAVQRTLGHSSIKTTQIYARLVDMDVVQAFKQNKPEGKEKKKRR